MNGLYIFEKKTSGGGIKNENITIKQFAEELYKPIIRKFNTRKVYSPFIENIWGADLADMQLWSKFNERFTFLLCVIDVYSKSERVISLKDKKGITLTNAINDYINKSNRKPK